MGWPHSMHGLCCLAHCVLSWVVSVRQGRPALPALLAGMVGYGLGVRVVLMVAPRLTLGVCVVGLVVWYHCVTMWVLSW